MDTDCLHGKRYHLDGRGLISICCDASRRVGGGKRRGEKERCHERMSVKKIKDEIPQDFMGPWVETVNVVFMKETQIFTVDNI